MAKHSKYGKLASEDTKKQFAEKLSSYTSLTAEEAESLFPKKADREGLLELIRIVNADADDKQKQAELIENYGKVGSAIIKITRKFLSGL